NRTPERTTPSRHGREPAYRPVRLCRRGQGKRGARACVLRVPRRACIAMATADALSCASLTQPVQSAVRAARSTKCATALRRRDLLPKEGTSLLGHGKSSCLIPSSKSECETKKSAWRNLAARQLPRYFLARSPLYLAVVLCHHQSWKEKVPVTFFSATRHGQVRMRFQLVSFLCLD